jgi:sporulation protein YlmC with PRC-barrel domain
VVGPESEIRLELGRPVHCTDGAAGVLEDLVVDPTTKHITHLIVKPPHDRTEARLVPMGLLELGGEDEHQIGLACTKAELHDLVPAERFAFLEIDQFPVDDPDWDVGVQDVLAMPYYEAAGMDGYAGVLNPETGVIYDRVPKGEVEIRRASAVVAADGHPLGHVDGFIADGDHITHLVLEHGHLWGKREVTIPITSVEKVETDLVTLSLSKDEVGELPSHRVRRWHD